jgi:dUTP pyrophosphatase
MSTRLNIEVGAGWIDRDYRGEILVELKNLGDKPVAISVGDRIAHLLVLRTIRVKPRLVRRLTPTRRATRGFGSTGGLPDARTD